MSLVRKLVWLMLAVVLLAPSLVDYLDPRWSDRDRTDGGPP
jgi:hypothetical protein